MSLTQKSGPIDSEFESQSELELEVSEITEFMLDLDVLDLGMIFNAGVLYMQVQCEL